MKNTHLRSFGIGLIVLSVAVLSFGARGILDRFATVKANEIVLVDKDGNTLIDMADFVGSNEEVQASMLELQTEVKIIRNRITDNRQFEESNERRYVAIQNALADLGSSIASLSAIVSANADANASAHQELSDAIEANHPPEGDGDGDDDGTCKDFECLGAKLEELSGKISDISSKIGTQTAALKAHKKAKKH